MTQIDVVGGCYREVCWAPKWDRIFGSGIRAAMTVASTGALVNLHSYIHDDWVGDIRASLEPLGVCIHPYDFTDKIMFEYGHEFAQPSVYPNEDEIKQSSDPITVSGEAILSFGLLEGNAVINAKKAVFDPQYGDISFGRNNSNADSLTVILNQTEFDYYGREKKISDKKDIASSICQSENADILIVKHTPSLYVLYEGEADPVDIIGYWSSEFFRIGLGDVFAAAYTSFWAGQGHSPHDACDLAAQFAARYAESRSPFLIGDIQHDGRAKKAENLIQIYCPADKFSEIAGAIGIADNLETRFDVEVKLYSALDGFCKDAREKEESVALIVTPSSRPVDDTPIVQAIEDFHKTGKRTILFVESHFEEWKHILPRGCDLVREVGTAIYLAATQKC